jgi:hypothetical protein
MTVDGRREGQKLGGWQAWMVGDLGGTLCAMLSALWHSIRNPQSAIKNPPPRNAFSRPQIHVDQAEFGGIADQLDGAVQFQFIHDVGTVIFHGLGADEKPFRNIS